MGYIVSFILAVVVGGGLFITGWLLKTANDQNGKDVGRVLTVLAPLVMVLWIGLHTLLGSFQTVDAGRVGVVYEFGSITSQIGEGPNWIEPWASVREENIQITSHPFEKLEAFSSETQDVFVKATLNLRVAPEAVQELYRTVGPNWYEVLVVPRVEQNFKDETVKYKSVDIAPSREAIRHAVRDRLKAELAPNSIEVVDLLLNNVDFTDAFGAAIESKQIATQRALEEEQRVQVADFQAQQAVKKAEGEGSAILAVAQKQAEANRELNASLTPGLIQYTLVQKLAPNVQVMLLPAGQEFILDSSLLKK